MLNAGLYVDNIPIYCTVYNKYLDRNIIVQNKDVCHTRVNAIAVNYV